MVANNCFFLLCSVNEINENLAFDPCLYVSSFLFNAIEKLSFTSWSVDKNENKKVPGLENGQTKHA